MEEEEKKKKGQKITNTTSEKYIIQKFTREFDRNIHEMFTDIESISQAQENE